MPGLNSNGLYENVIPKRASALRTAAGQGGQKRNRSRPPLVSYFYRSLFVRVHFRAGGPPVGWAG